MSKKFTANGLWESNRMMLPQHKERINVHQAQKKDIIKPHLHEDEREIIAQNIGISLRYTLVATFKIFHTSGYKYIQGIVVSIDPSHQRIKVELEEGHASIDFNSICSVHLDEGGDDFETNR